MAAGPGAGNVILTDAEVIALWLKAGGSLSSAPMALARAKSESGGRPAVTSANPDGGTNVGIWQLDTKGVGAGHSVAQLSDPLTNAEITVKATRDGKDWADWADNWQLFEAESDSAVADFRTRAQHHAGGLSGLVDALVRGLGQGLKDVTGPVGSLLGLPSQVTSFFDTAGTFAQSVMWITNPASWARILSGLAGLTLGLLGIYALARAA